MAAAKLSVTRAENLSGLCSNYIIIIYLFLSQFRQVGILFHYKKREMGEENPPFYRHNNLAQWALYWMVKILDGLEIMFYNHIC
jgi:hypothetical protein